MSWIESLELRRMMATGVITGVITGVVFQDSNRNGVREAEEKPLVGYRVFIDRNHDGVCNRNELWTRTSKTGRYTFSGLGAGVYRIGETTVETMIPTTPTWYQVSLREGGRVVRSFGNAGGSIAGYVFIDTNHDGSRGEGEVGVGAAHVWLDINDDGEWELGEPIVRTRSNGRYVFSDLPASTYRVRVFPIETLHFTDGDSRRVKLGAGAILARNFGVLPGELPIT